MLFKLKQMKKLNVLFISLLFFLTTIIYSQKVSGSVVYKIHLIGYGAQNKDSEFNQLNEATINIANQQTCTLTFNTSRSSSILDKVLVADNENNGLMAMARTMAFIVTNEYDYFFDKLNNSAIKREENGNLIKNDHKILNWEITTESKVIDSYLCYKAIFYDRFINRKGIAMSLPIVAWFAPSLPYSYGPKYFNGLPGLILELNDRETTFLASSIKIFKDKELEIVFPKGKTVSQEDYNKKVLSN